MMNNLEELREHCEEMMAVSPLGYAYIPAPSIITLIERIEKAEAELSAANEKLKNPVVLPSLYDPQIAGDAITRAVCFSYNRAVKKCASAIKTAGFTVEGE